MKEKLKKAIPKLPDASPQIPTGARIHRNFHTEDGVHSQDIQDYRKRGGIDTTADANWVETTPEIIVTRGSQKQKKVLREDKFAQTRLLDFGHLHGILVDTKASAVIVPGATEQQFKGTREYNAAHTLGVGLKSGIF
jgi:hypothetical protein